MIAWLLALGLGYVAYRAVGQLLERRIASTRLGEQRRKLFPPEQGISLGAKTLSSSPDVELKKEFYRLRDGMQIFFHILKPKGKQPTHALVRSLKLAAMHMGGLPTWL